MTQLNFKILLLAAATESVHAAIQTDSWLWRSTINAGDISFVNGVATSSDSTVERRILATRALEEHDMTDYSSKANAVRVKSILSE